MAEESSQAKGDGGESKKRPYVANRLFIMRPLHWDSRTVNTYNLLESLKKYGRVEWIEICMEYFSKLIRLLDLPKHPEFQKHNLLTDAPAVAIVCMESYDAANRAARDLDTKLYCGIKIDALVLDKIEAIKQRAKERDAVAAAEKLERPSTPILDKLAMFAEGLHNEVKSKFHGKDEDPNEL